MNIWMRLGLFFVCLAIFAFAAVEAYPGWRAASRHESSRRQSYDRL
jgi:hypothetical protein